MYCLSHVQTYFQIQKSHISYIFVLFYKPFDLPIPQLVIKVNYGNTKTWKMYITPHCSVRPPIEIKMRASAWPSEMSKLEECNPQKVQGHKLQHLGYNIAQYEAIWLTLIFWSKCPTWGHPDLGQPVIIWMGLTWFPKSWLVWYDFDEPHLDRMWFENAWCVVCWFIRKSQNGVVLNHITFGWQYSIILVPNIALTHCGSLMPCGPCRSSLAQVKIYT